MRTTSLILCALLLAAPIAANADPSPAPASTPAAIETPGGNPVLPSDVYASSNSRVPLITRDRVPTEAGKQMYDEAVKDPTSLVGLQGPGGISLYNPEYDAAQRPLNRFLRFHTGLDRKLVEVAILVSARETNQPFEWHAHEIAGRAAGVSAATIDVIRYRRPVSALDPKEAAIITLGREAIGRHHVTPATFANAQRLFGTDGLIDVTAVMGDYLMTGLVLTTFDQHLPPGTPSDLPTP